MKTIDPTIRVVDADGEAGLDHARHLFRSYAEEYAASIAETLCLQGFEAEVAGLPGRYVPPSGCLLLAMEGDTPAGCVGLRDLGDGTCEMKRLYVVPRFRGSRRRTHARRMSSFAGPSGPAIAGWCWTQSPR